MMDEDDNIQDRALPIVDLDGEFDLDIPPTSAQDYLKRVHLEAKNCPDVVVASIDRDVACKKQTFQVSSSNGCSPCPAGYAPGLAWQRKQIADFSEVRQILSSCRSRQPANDSTLLLDLDDVEGWCKLCFGRIVMDKSNDSEEVSNESKQPVLHQKKLNYEDGTPPLLKIIAKMDQPTVLQVLEYHVSWFETTGFTEEQGRWFYALLASIEKPLSPETCSLLRRLSRNCWNLRVTLSKEEPSLIALNLMIALVGRYFDQTDLADQG